MQEKDCAQETRPGTEVIIPGATADSREERVSSVTSLLKRQRTEKIQLQKLRKLNTSESSSSTLYLDVCFILCLGPGTQVIS